MQRKKELRLTRLPKELLLSIFSFLEINNINDLALVSKYFKKLTEMFELWGALPSLCSSSSLFKPQPNINAKHLYFLLRKSRPILPSNDRENVSLVVPERLLRKESILSRVTEKKSSLTFVKFKSDVLSICVEFKMNEQHYMLIGSLNDKKQFNLRFLSSSNQLKHYKEKIKSCYPEAIKVNLSDLFNVLTSFLFTPINNHSEGELLKSFYNQIIDLDKTKSAVRRGTINLFINAMVDAIPNTATPSQNPSPACVLY